MVVESTLNNCSGIVHTHLGVRVSKKSERLSCMETLM
jgi:hypothetical protein